MPKILHNEACSTQKNICKTYTVNATELLTCGITRQELPQHSLHCIILETTTITTFDLIFCSLSRTVRQ